MNKILLLIFLCLYSFISSGQIIDGFWGIKFGTPKSEVYKIIKKKSGRQGMIPDNNSLFIEDVQFGDSDAKSIFFNFENDTLIGGLVRIEPDKEAEILHSYNDICNDFRLKYGSPKEKHYEFFYPYSQNDDQYVYAIKGGYTNILSKWFDILGNSIMISIDKEMTVSILYVTSNAIDMYNKKAKEKRNEDY